jgi:hypothetical protein
MKERTMFIETTDQQYIPLHQIVRVGRCSNDALGTRTITTVDGNKYQVANYIVEDFKVRAGGAFAATPGHYLVLIPPDEFLISEPDFAFDRMPITAWYVNEWGSLSPLTVEFTSETSRRRWAVQFPDGTVIEPEAHHWDSLDQCQRDCREEAAQRRREQAAESQTKEPASS